MKNIFNIFKKRKKKSYSSINQRSVVSNNKPYTPEVKNFSMTYKIPLVPASDEQFIANINEFICVQYSRRNTYSGNRFMSELICSEHPELKERFLRFLEEHPIKSFLDGDKYSHGCDLNTWEIRFIFDNADLNRTISGYGYTELTAPYLTEILRDTCEILTPSEIFERKMKMAVYNSQTLSSTQEETSKNEQE